MHDRNDEIYQALLDELFDSAYVVDINRKITFWNRSAERLTGYKREEVQHCKCSDNILTHVDSQGVNLCHSGCPLEQTLKDGCSRESDVFLHHKNGSRIPITVRISPLKNKEGDIVGAVELFSDNSSKLAMQKQIDELQRLALIDPLTQLGNRRYMEMTLQTRLSELERHDLSFGVLFIDIDDFKSVNDVYGHDTGDGVLEMVAETLLHNSRATDTFGRWGGEEILGVIRTNDVKGFRNYAERIRMLIEKSYLRVGERTVQVTASIGATMAQPNDTVDELVGRADRLMYQSKETSKNAVTFDF